MGVVCPPGVPHLQQVPRRGDPGEARAHDRVAPGRRRRRRARALRGRGRAVLRRGPRAVEVAGAVLVRGRSTPTGQSRHARERAQHHRF